VLDGQAHWRNVRVEETRIDDTLHVGCFRRLDHVVVVLGALANFARRDEKQHIDPRERRFQGRGFGIVSLANGHALPSRVRRRANERDDGLAGLGFQFVNDKAAEVACGSGPSHPHLSAL
jgi:hypothetical protein